jgi:hypothetical protein
VEWADIWVCFPLNHRTVVVRSDNHSGSGILPTELGEETEQHIFDSIDVEEKDELHSNYGGWDKKVGVLWTLMGELGAFTHCLLCSGDLLGRRQQCYGGDMRSKCLFVGRQTAILTCLGLFPSVSFPMLSVTASGGFARERKRSRLSSCLSVSSVNDAAQQKKDGQRERDATAAGSRCPAHAEPSGRFQRVQGWLGRPSC